MRDQKIIVLIVFEASDNPFISFFAFIVDHSFNPLSTSEFIAAGFIAIAMVFMQITRWSTR